METTPHPPANNTAAADRLRQALIRNFNTAPREAFAKGERYRSDNLSLTNGTAAVKLGCSYDEVPPGKLTCPYHLHHAQEEMFIVIEGCGTLRVAGELLAIEAGDVISIPAGAEYPHHILNTSDAPLKYLSISTKEWPEICEYPDSGKTQATMRSSVPDAPAVSTLRNRPSANLDYWDNEPI